MFSIPILIKKNTMQHKKTISDALNLPLIQGKI